MEYSGLYLCSRNKTGPWFEVYANSYEYAAQQFARSAQLNSGDVVFVGLPAPVPQLFEMGTLARYLAEQLGVAVSPALESLALSVADSANHQVEQFVERQPSIGKVERVREIQVIAKVGISPLVFA